MQEGMLRKAFAGFVHAIAVYVPYILCCESNGKLR